LHAHLLACLLEIPNTIWNNSYGKNHTYVAAWTGASDVVQLGPVNRAQATEAVETCCIGTC
jgi:pyruvyl transferase EpsO